MNIICLNKECIKKSKCATFGTQKDGDENYQNYANYQAYQCKQFKKIL